MHLSFLLRSPAVRIYLTMLAVGLGWALYTNHTWEDYYITYRASKNLATGHGLTFTAAERVHSFTSPLGVLLPAFANLLSGHRSDYVALWIFRLMSIGAYAGAGVILWKLAITLKFGRFSSALLVVLFSTDAKIVDFSTNGMETGFLLLFLIWTLFALIASPPRQSVHLGLAWAGLMWTRPDSFIYILVLAIGSLLFLRTNTAGESSRRVVTFLRAGLMTTVIYLPWLIWAWNYYGTPIPHTVTAKGLFHSSTTLSSLGTAIAAFPASVAANRDMLATTFMPPYSANTGWPGIALSTSYWIAVACLIVWLIPGVRRPTRLASFAFFCGEFYLVTYVQFPVPWYIPTVTVFAFVVIAGLVSQILEITERPFRSTTPSALQTFAIARTVIVGVSTLLPVGALAITGLAAQQLKQQQIVIEHGQRREIGRWLRSKSTGADTVFLEPLGYIGFYSNLKMLDYPGLSSPEVVAARKRASRHDYPGCWPELILDLAPTWLVLRSYEVEAINKQTPELLRTVYSLARTFDVRDKVNAIDRIQGRGYLLNDALFEVYRRNEQPTRNGSAISGIQPIRTSSLLVNEALGGRANDSGLKISAHAPSRLVIERSKSARWISGTIGIEPGAYDNPAAGTDGASFQIFFLPRSGERQLLFRRDLNPRDQVADRGPQSFSADLPGDTAGKIELQISPGPSGNSSFDWTYWSFLRFEVAASD
jgi:hypothetical protein